MVGYYIEDIGGDDGAYHELTINADLTGVISYEGSDSKGGFVERDGQLLFVVESADEPSFFPVGDYALTIIDEDTIQVEGFGPTTFRRSER
jgi:hypothetical protein